MKRYLYLLLATVVAFTSCEKIFQTETTPDVVWCFSSVEVETTETSATVNAVKPYITIDGVKEEGVDIYLKFWEDGNEEGHIIINEFEEMGDHIIFTINDLAPATHYLGGIVVSGEYGGEISSIFPITTKEHTPKCEIAYTVDVDAKGIMATITLSNVSYLVDGEAQEIESVKLEYARKRSDLEWIEVDMTGKESVRLPEEGGAYLDESSTYLYRITITPNGNYEPITSTESEFKTEYAEVTAELSKPNVAIIGDNIEVVVESVKVWFDGVERPDYYALEYFVYYRETGGETAYWENKAEVELTNGGISLSLAISSFDKGKEYEFAGAVEAGAEHKVRLSEIVTVTIPNSDEPTPPTPPVSGEADTSTIAGSWHLTEWRGEMPSFDVYLSISEDGVVTLYQRLESREWELFYSVVSYENNTISGEYSDGVAWGASYSVALEGDTMTWTDTVDPTDTSVYTRAELPIITATTTTRAESGVGFL